MTIPPNSEVLQKLTSIEYRIKRLKEALPYADGPQYYLDQEEIRKLEATRYELLSTLKKFPM